MPRPASRPILRPALGRPVRPATARSPQPNRLRGLCAALAHLAPLAPLALAMVGAALPFWYQTLGR
ncbi:hypothetical protein [Cupriavidus pauculus]|uniref:hypothetical protein n=1 Tax=Cupriavidus pauculus TaxID=82633 RepID=UPI00385779B7